MGEEFQGGVCGGTWWNPPHSLFSGGLSSPCSVAQLGGGTAAAFDMGNFGWQNEVMKAKLNNNYNQVFNNLIIPDQMDFSLDILGFGLSPTSSSLPNDWNHHQNMICNNGSNEGNFDLILEDNLNNTRLFPHGMGENPSNMTITSTNFCNNSNKKSNVDNQQGGASPPMALTASSNSSGDSSTITTEGGGCSGGGLITTSFPMNSPASYLIQSLFDDSDVSQVALDPQSSMAHNNNNNHFINPSDYGSLGLSNEIISSNTWVKSSSHNINSTQQPATFHSNQLLLAAQDNKFNGGMMNVLINGGHEQGQNSQFPHATLSCIRASLLNSLQSRSRGPSSFNQKPHSFAKKVNSEEHRLETKNNNDHDHHSTKRPRIETPSSLPTFKVRKEKLGDRITALQQLVSPFGKTDTASVLHEAIEYIKFLHDQVNVLSTPYLKSGTPMQQQGCERRNGNEEGKHDLRSRGLCLVPISSTYPVAQETPVDFWTPTFR